MRIIPCREPARPMLHAALLTLLCCVPPTASSGKDDPSKPPSGEVRLSSGRVVNYTIHFDRNSLRGSVRVGDGMIALTSSGTLLRFELPTFRLVREWLGPEQVTCVGLGEADAVLAGLSDGRVCRVDSATLELTDLVKLPSRPQWIMWNKAMGKRPAGLIVVTRQTKVIEQGAKTFETFQHVVNDLAMGKTFEPEHKVSTLLLDRAGRLWLGADMGEWGGRVTRLDLVAGTLSEVKPPSRNLAGIRDHWDGVYGFVELRDGQVWAYGGSSHMGFNSASFARTDGAAARMLVSIEPPRELQREPEPESRPEPRPSRPRMPITHVFQEEGGLLVVSYSDVFRVDKELTSWKWVATLDLEYRWGRPDAVGAYPAVCAVNPPRRSGEPYVLATIGDGYLALEAEKVTPRALPGQLGAADVVRIENSSEGTLCFEEDTQNPVWRLGSKGWEIASLAPPLELDPADAAGALEAELTSWFDTRVLVGPGGAVYTVSGTNGLPPGTRTTARRVGGKSERIGRETSSLEPSASFLTADGTLWNAFSTELKRFDKGRWETVAELTLDETSARLDPINTNGPPWLLRDRSANSLWRLQHGPRWENSQLHPIDISEGGRALRVDDAIPWTATTLLLATDGGLRRFEPGTSKLSRIELPEPPRPATRIARDGLGRLWLGGSHGLWMLEAGGKSLESCDRVPWLDRSAVHALARDPKHDDGVIVALGKRGVAFVRAKPLR